MEKNNKEWSRKRNNSQEAQRLATSPRVSPGHLKLLTLHDNIQIVTGTSNSCIGPWCVKQRGHRLVPHYGFRRMPCSLDMWARWKAFWEPSAASVHLGIQVRLPETISTNSNHILRGFVIEYLVYCVTLQRSWVQASGLVCTSCVTLVVHCVHACVHAESLQSCPTLRDPMDCSPSGPMDCSPSGSSVHGILQARILEWVAVPSSKGSSLPRDRTWVSYVSCSGRRVLYH